MSPLGRPVWTATVELAPRVGCTWLKQGRGGAFTNVFLAAPDGQAFVAAVESRAEMHKMKVIALDKVRLLHDDGGAGSKLAALVRVASRKNDLFFGTMQTYPLDDAPFPP